MDKYFIQQTYIVDQRVEKVIQQTELDIHVSEKTVVQKTGMVKHQIGMNNYQQELISPSNEYNHPAVNNGYLDDTEGHPTDRDSNSADRISYPRERNGNPADRDSRPN